MTRKTTFITGLMLASLLAIPGRNAVAQDTALQPVIDAALTQELAAPVSGLIDWVRRHNDWVLVCGTPRTPEGEPLDYQTTNRRDLARDGLVDDQFCALLRGRAGCLTVEVIDAGSTDAPILDWIDRYGLPADMLSD